MRRAVGLVALGSAAVAGLLAWVMLEDDGLGADTGAPRFASLEALADRLGDLGYGCDDVRATSVDRTGESASGLDPRRAAGSCTFGEVSIDLAQFPDAAHQRRFRELAERIACPGDGEDYHYVNGNLWIVELVSPDPDLRDPDLVRRMARDLEAEYATIDC